MGRQHQFGAEGGVASGNNIQRFREERGWSRPELGKRMNTSGQQVERLEKAQRRLTQDWIERAARALGVEPVDIIAPDRGEVPDQPVARSLDAGETVEIIRLDLSLPMGPGASVDDYVEEEPLRFDLGYVQAFTRTPAHRLRLAHGVGDSMFPTLLNSDLVWIDSTQNTLNQADKVWAVSINGAAAIKRLRPLREGKVLVISDNPTIENYEVAADELRIGGRVIRFARDL
ncbi:helix-turn-helix domain-containing protein [Sphingomonas sp. RRHST34]|uniref:Helix-turn-helix domain-containing protein n=1 Tax=Sphingomonas citri TaxID=2862499 RepID=A0ABS7BQW0_9SPHN|nr:helix-turn-helix domain-containing protein [Sphingomonas citri]